MKNNTYTLHLDDVNSFIVKGQKQEDGKHAIQIECPISIKKNKRGEEFLYVDKQKQDNSKLTITIPHGLVHIDCFKEKELCQLINDLKKYISKGETHMKINDKRKKTTTFGDLAIGDWFETCNPNLSTRYAIKLSNAFSQNCLYFTEDNSHLLDKCSDDVEVKPIEVELNIIR